MNKEIKTGRAGPVFNAPAELHVSVSIQVKNVCIDLNGLLSRVFHRAFSKGSRLRGRDER